MNKTEIAIVGGGPAGICAALTAAQQGAQVTVIDRNPSLGGQLIKQTHMFFGSKAQYASSRGIDIPNEIITELKKYKEKINFLLDTTVLSYFDDGVLLLEKNDKTFTLKPDSIVVATGGAEKMLPFPNNDLPGIYGAGAVQTLMNVYGIKPGNRVLMIGAGNIGLIVSYQLLQSGVDVIGIVEGAPKIGGYLVHASKVKRLGVPIYTSYTIKEAYGQDHVEGAIISKLDESWKMIPGTEIDLKVDVICLAVGLTPLTELLWQAGCQHKFIPELGGYVPTRNQLLQTTIPNIYVAGDVGGIEEASIAMVEGKLAGLTVAMGLGYKDNYEEQYMSFQKELEELRSGATGVKSRKGLEKLFNSDRKIIA
jgi:sarcosine oxidase subunit alpha